MIKDLGLDFSYNDKNYKSAIIDLYNQLQDLCEWAEIMDDEDSLGHLFMCETMTTLK